MEFFYEGAKTNSWAVEISSDKLSRIKTAYESAFLTEFPSSTKNCKYYSFSYQRKPTTKTYNLPFTRAVQTDYGSSCLYSIEPIWNDLRNIEALGGAPLSSAIMQALQSLRVYKDSIALGTVCSRWLANGKICLPTTNDLECNKNVGGCFGEKCTASCLNSIGCEIDISQGEKEYFGVTLDNDECGNKKIIPDNNGKPVLLEEVERRVRDFVDECSVKYKQQTKCGNGKIDEGEECDRSKFKDYGDGVDKCKIFNSEKYVSGNLKCFPKGHEKQCKVDVSECKECNAKENLGYIISEGGVKNRLAGSRARFWGKLDSYFVRYNKIETGLEAEMTTKMWFHADLYKVKYDDITKFDPSKDKFNLAEFFPPKDYGKHFIIILTTKIKDGKITLNSQYSPYGDSPPDDLAGFVISNPEKTTEKTVDIKKDEVFALITEKMFNKIIFFFVEGNTGGIFFLANM